MNISEIEKITGISKQAIRFYEKEGLISPKRNQDNQYREYDENDVRTLKMIYVFRKVGLSVGEISKVLKEEVSINDAMNKRRAEIIKERKEQEQLIEFCDSLKLQSKEWIDVDKYINIIQEEEKQGNKFFEILDEYKQVYRGEWKKHFYFYPEGIITTPREFTNELLIYAKNYGHDITITKEGMYPEFILDGVEYSAMRISGRWHTVHCQMIHPELAEPENVTGKKKVILQLIARLIPLIFIILIGIFLMLSGVLTDISVVFWIVMIIVLIAFWYPYKGKKDY